MGYANRLVHVDFTEELAEAGDSIWVTIRNPKLMTANELRPRNVAMLPDGVTPVNMEDATEAMYETLSRMIVGWHVYDASDLALNEDGTPGEQQLLAMPTTPELVAKLPAIIIKRLSEEMSNAINPK